ncbi:hypothetical protein HPB47_005862 [Ixodes persulcatus]|uniref:Uncharacterized protein n=1 Tax=Ixodes persulcatus TaxID=34615 RepID=A0AC60PBU0_IXOPE|nr:hypothetical protein HPB47_005862 [Ixodes persulcatus]
MTNEVTPLQPEKTKGATNGADTCWRVAIIASLTTFFTTVTIKNSGIIFIGLIERLSMNRGQAAWPISIQEGAILTAGLLVHLLQQKMPIDQIALLGTVLTWSGLVASAFTPSVTWMSVTYGIVHGVVGNYSENIFLTTIIDFATDSGVSLATATSIILYTSTTDLLGRLALPFFADKTSVKSKSLVLCCHVLLGLFMMLLPHHATSFPLLLSISLCIAMFIACVITMKSLLIADYFGYKQISVMYGLSGLVALPLFIANPRILGFFRDFHGTYDNLYRLVGGLNVFAGFILSIAICSERSYLLR